MFFFGISTLIELSGAIPIGGIGGGGPGKHGGGGGGAMISCGGGGGIGDVDCDIAGREPCRPATF